MLSSRGKRLLPRAAVHGAHLVVHVDHFPGFDVVNKDGVIDRVVDGLEELLARFQFRRAKAVSAAERSVPGEEKQHEQPRRNGSGRNPPKGHLAKVLGSIPHILDRLEFTRSNLRKTVFHFLQQRRFSFGHGPMKFANKQGRGMPETVLEAELVQIVKRQRIFRDEDR